MDDLLVFGDLYCVQRAQVLRCNGPLSGRQLTAFVEFLGRRTRVGIRHRTFYEHLPMAYDDVDTLCGSVLSLYERRQVTWPELVAEFLTRLARFLGKRRWGYKTPQDFHNIGLLRDAFPNVRFILLVRDPRTVMASFKFNSSQDGSRGQYHPLAYAQYWKMAVTSAVRSCTRLSVPLCVVRFEDMIRAPQATGHLLAEFLGSRLDGPISRSSPNSSFGSSGRREITRAEVWLCQKIAGEMMSAYDYKLVTTRPRLRDVPDLAFTTLRFIAHQSTRLCTDRAARVQVGAFCKRLLTARHI